MAILISPPSPLKIPHKDSFRYDPLLMKSSEQYTYVTFFWNMLSPLAPEHRADERVPQLRDQAVRPGGLQGHPGHGTHQGDHWHAGLRR